MIRTYLIALVIIFYVLCINALGLCESDILCRKIGSFKKKHFIIWYHNIHYSDVSNLETILRSGIITHIMLASGHRFDYNYRTSKEIKNIINTIRTNQVYIIWTKPLWPVDKIKDISGDMLYSSEFYLNEIKTIKLEAKEIGADYTCFDTEPYGRAPVKKYFKGSPQLKANNILLNDAINGATASCNCVDFILPAGSVHARSPYQIIARLGRYKISEDTYYFYKEKKYERIKYEYDILGIYIPFNRNLKFSRNNTIGEIILRGLSISKNIGILLYPKEDSIQMIANTICQLCEKN